jgi:hypothetical protein
MNLSSSYWDFPPNPASTLWTFRIDETQNVSYIEAATFLSSKEVIPEVHETLSCKREALVDLSKRLSFYFYRR